MSSNKGNYHLVTTAWRQPNSGEPWSYECVVTQKRPAVHLIDTINLVNRERPGAYEVVIVCALPICPTDAHKLAKLV